MVNLWYMGVALEIFSTMSGTVGKQLIRLSELSKRTKPHLSKLSLVVGLLVNTLVGPLIDMGAYSFAPQSLIAPFGGLDVVWNALLAPYILKEQLTLGRAAGCGFIMVGTSLAGIFGNHDEPEYTVEFIQETLLNMRVLVYCCAFAGWFLLNRLWLMRYPPGSAIRGVSLGCTAGTIAGNMFCVKAAIELIQRSIQEEESGIWLHWLPYVLLAGAIFFAVSNVGYMTQGLQEYEALFMVTIYEGSMIVSGCLSGAVVLLDLRGLAYWHVLLYGFGVLVIVLGMWVIFSQEAKIKSSLLQRKASIESLPRTQELRAKVALNRRSLHASCGVELASVRGDRGLRLSRSDSSVLTRVSSEPMPCVHGQPTAACGEEEQHSAEEGGCKPIARKRPKARTLPSTQLDHILLEVAGDSFGTPTKGDEPNKSPEVYELLRVDLSCDVIAICRERVMGGAESAVASPTGHGPQGAAATLKLRPAKASRTAAPAPPLAGEDGLPMFAVQPVASGRCNTLN